MKNKRCERCKDGRVFDSEILSIYCGCRLGKKRKRETRELKAASGRGAFEETMTVIQQLYDDSEGEYPPTVSMCGLLMRKQQHLILAIWPSVTNGRSAVSRWIIRGNSVERTD